MKHFFILFIALITISSCSEAQENAGVVNKVVDAETFKSLNTEDVQLIDVRTPEEFNQGSIKGATNINYYSDNFQEELNKLDKEKTVLVYCAVGGRSGKAAKALKESGFKEVYDLKGGYNNWPYK